MSPRASDSPVGGLTIRSSPRNRRVRLWIDAHLSPALASWLQATFGIDAAPLRDLGLRDAEDAEIFARLYPEHFTGKDMTNPSRRIDTRYLALGIAVGVALGVALDNLGPWIAVGVAIGLTLGRVRRRPD